LRALVFRSRGLGAVRGKLLFDRGPLARDLLEASRTLVRRIQEHLLLLARILDRGSQSGGLILELRTFGTEPLSFRA
jgi:hypothetical protein